MSELPPSVATYIVDELGYPLTHVVAHRLVHGEETKYAVLMKTEHADDHFLVVFVGNYSAYSPLGDYQEATRDNARLDSWDCLYDSEPWEHTVGKFKNASEEYF